MSIRRNTCKSDGCTNFVWARGYCRTHDAIANPHKYKLKKGAVMRKSKPKKKLGAAKQKRKKLITLPKLDSFVWEITSLAYRLEDADEMGNVLCATCKKQMFYYGTGKCQMGHFVSRRKKIVKFERKNQMSQCAGCNGPGNGQQYLMGCSIDQKHGIGTASLMIQKSSKLIKFDRNDYKEVLIENIMLLWKMAKKKSLFEWKDGMPKWKLALIERVVETYPDVGELEIGTYRLP